MMIYSNVYFDTKVDANFVDKKWHITYNLTQGRVNQTGIKNERSLTFKIESGLSYDSAYRDIMVTAMKELSQYNFDLFKIPDSAFITLKERIEDGTTKDNKITKN